MPSFSTNESGSLIVHADDGRALAYGGVDSVKTDTGTVAIFQVHGGPNGELVDGPTITSADDPTLAQAIGALKKGAGGDSVANAFEQDVLACLTRKAQSLANDAVANSARASGDQMAASSSATAGASSAQPHSVTLDARLHQATNVDTDQVAVHKDSVGFLHLLWADVANGVEGAARRFEVAFQHVFGKPA